MNRFTGDRPYIDPEVAARMLFDIVQTLIEKSGRSVLILASQTRCSSPLAAVLPSTPPASNLLLLKNGLRSIAQHPDHSVV
jgi:hypothetical protein